MEEVAEATTTFSILGALSVSVRDEAVVVAGYRRRALLARLALTPGVPVSAERMADDLWEDEPDRRSLPTLRTYVAKLRHLLPDGARLLVSSPAGYSLAITAEAVDAFHFERLARGTGDDPSTTERDLREALGLWRGNALEEFADLYWAQVEASRLDELRLVVQERLADAQLALGHHTDIVPTLGALTAAHPLRERFHIQLVTALYRSGRQAEALDAQRHARSLLRSELGLEPSDQLADLERQILTHDAALAAPAERVPHTQTRPRPLQLPAGLRPRRGEPAFVGRSTELGDVTSALEDVGSAGARLVVLTGEPGIGKTRLAAHVAASAVDRDTSVLYGRCDDGLGAPYQPFVEALKEFTTRAPLDTLAANLGSDPGALVNLAPELAPYLPVGPTVWASPDPAAEQLRLFDAVAGWLRALTADGPVLLVLDDMQWAARSTAMLTQHIVRALHDRPVLFLATLRSSDAPTDTPMAAVIAGLHRDQAVDVIALDGLDDEAISELVTAESVATSVDERVVEQFREATAGSPFLLTQLARHTSGFDADEVPPAVRDVLLQRVQRLPATTRDVVRVASIVGLEFELSVVARVVDRPEDDTLTALDDAVAAGLLHELDGATGRYAFSHTVLRRTVYESFSATRRAHLHADAATALQTMAEVRSELVLRYADEIALHWRIAGHDHSDEAAEWCARAGRQALRVLAYDDAARLLTAAVDASPGRDDAWRCQLLLDLASAHALNGDAATARESLLHAALLARASGDAIALARAALGSTVGGRGVSEWIADDLRTGLLDEAYSALPLDAHELRIQVGGALALALYLPEQRGRRQQLARDAVALAEADGSSASLAAALPASRVRYWRTAEAPERLAFARSVLAIAEHDRDPWLAASALDWIAGDCLELGERDGFEDALARYHELAEEVGGAVLTWRASVLDTHVTMLRGALVDSERLATAALAAWGDDPAPDAIETVGFQLGIIRMLEGRGTDVVAIADQALESRPHIQGAHAARAYGLALAGRLDAASAEATWCAADDLDNMPQDSGWLLATVILAEAAALTRDRDVIATVVRALSPHADRFAMLVGPSVSWGTVTHQLGALALATGDADAAVRHLARACELERSFGAVPWLARSLARLATAHRAAGDHAAANAADAERAAIATFCAVVVPS